MKCVRVSFRVIRSNLHFEITSSYLWQQGIIEQEPRTGNIIQRGKLIKASIRHRSRGCVSLLTSLKDQQESFFKQVLDAWNKHKNFGRYIYVHVYPVYYAMLNHQINILQQVYNLIFELLKELI